ncbi:ferredoxin [Rhodococcus sp. ACS1]|uniref:2Fe-2S iron-sulfur cluster-binding protein n=1 Tax=Rhodococcus sp. ACS1 TaxID=2028570 RepID=UPI000BB119C9|nr:ferredoxin [Rhodococcus sp. ACS1]
MAPHSDCGGSVRILPADEIFETLPRETVVEAVRRAGYRIRYACRRGGCGACKATLVSGEVIYSAVIVDELISTAQGEERTCLPCQAIPVGDIKIRLHPRDRLRRIAPGLPRRTGTGQGGNR